MPDSRLSSAMVIVGAGLAGGNAAVTLREEGYRGRIVLAGTEPGVPFGRPPLSKTYLRGEETLDGWYVRPPDWYGEHDVDLLHGSAVVAIDPATQEVVIGGGQHIPYDELLIATGGRNRRLQVPGIDLEGVHQLRTLPECDAIRAAALPGSRALVVGMGFIGSEVAASLRQMGLHVTAILDGSFPLARVLGEELGSVYADIHREKGVELITRERVVSFEGPGVLRAAVTDGGTRVECDLAVIGIGIEPDVEVLLGTEVAIDNGVLVDERLQTKVARIYAAGDVANQLHPVFGRVRVEHYNNAEKQGRAAARAMLGSDQPYRYIHSFWSDQFEHKLEYVGHSTRWDQFVMRGSLDERQVLGFYLEDGVLRAAAGLNRGGDPELEPDSELAACARLIDQRARPDAALLSGESRDLWDLVHQDLQEKRKC
jgi:3-phenylpropionate/trans-cinnamate dioxygenase ferredoxin reductase component